MVKDPVGRSTPSSQKYAEDSSEQQEGNYLGNLPISPEKFKKSCYLYKYRTKSTFDEDPQCGTSDDDEESSIRLGIMGSTYTIPNFVS